MHRPPLDLPLAVAFAALAVAPLRAQLSLQSQFPSGVSPVACAHDPATGTVWVYESFGTNIRKFSSAGAPLGTIPRPGASADDADLEVAPVAFQLGGTVVQAGTLLFVDGESGTAEIYGIDPLSGVVIASLATSFGSSHVVGGAYHVQRGTFFLVQDRVPVSAAQRNLVAEIDPVSGAVLGTFQTTQANPAFTVNYGDIEVTANGNLLVVSSDETEIGQFTPQGAWVLGHPLPPGVTPPSGIAVDPAGCGLWVASPSGPISRLLATCPTTSPHAAGCSGPGANNSLTVTSLPWIGTAFRASATGMPPVALVLAVTGLQPFAPPIPLLALLPQAIPGCDLHTPPDLLLASFAVNGQAESQILLGADPSFVGVPFFHQMVVMELDPVTLAVTNVTSTNAVQATIGSY